MAGFRFKSAKSGGGRTVALSATVVDELRSPRQTRPRTFSGLAQD